MHKLVFFVPETHLDTVKDALFAKGAGKDKKYSHCCWQVCGQMQFKPLPGSEPAIGETNELARTQEYRVEMICQEALLTEVLAELHRVHPYEMPAYEVYRLEDY